MGRLHLKGLSKWLNAHNNHIVLLKTNRLRYRLQSVEGKVFYFLMFYSPFLRKFSAFPFFFGRLCSLSFSVDVPKKKNLFLHDFSCQGAAQENKTSWGDENSNAWIIEIPTDPDSGGKKEENWKTLKWLKIYFCCLKMHQHHPPSCSPFSQLSSSSITFRKCKNQIPKFPQLFHKNFFFSSCCFSFILFFSFRF